MDPETENELDPVAKEDAEILYDVIKVCRDGEMLYRHVAGQVEDQQSRNIFSYMARVLSKIVRELESEVLIRVAKPKKIGSAAGQISQWYSGAKSRFVDYHDKAFIDQLVETTERSLQVFRAAVREVEDRSLVYRLSSQVASFQIAYDRMRTFKNSYR